MNPASSDRNRIIAVIAYLNAAIANTRLYGMAHPQVMRYLERAHAELSHLLRTRAEITFIVVDRDLLVDHQPLVTRTPHVSQFVQLLTRGAVERLTFSAGVPFDEMIQLVGDLAGDDQSIVRSTACITLGKVQVRGAQADFTPEMRERIEQMALARDLSLEQLKELYLRLKSARHPPATGFEQIVHSFVSGIGSHVPPLHVLASLKSADEYTFTHAINVCILTMAQAEALGIGGRKLYDIGIAASLHDAGKMFVPEEILNKPGALSAEEWTHMRNHTLRGARQLLRMDGLPKLAFIGALEHHIRFDGSGYPVLGNRRPGIVSQMIAIADMFDAMRSRRPYQPPKPDALIFDILRKESGTAFNPLLVDSFLRLIHR